MKNSGVRLWSLAFLTLFSVALFCLTIMVVLSLRDPRLKPNLTAQPWYLVTGILLSGCTGAYCTVELVRCIRGLRPFLAPVLAVVLIFAGLVSSAFCMMGAAPMRKRSADTTILPELRLIDARIEAATRTPSSP